MDVDTKEEEVIAPTCDGQGSISVALHPLVVLNLSEHWTRTKMEKSSNMVVVYGALLGKQQGRHVEVANSFELVLDEETLIVDKEFFKIREGQCKQVYPDLDFIGWYTTGGTANSNDQQINKQLQEMTESPLLVKLDPLQRGGDRLPIRIYESVVDSEAQVLFKEVAYTLATEEAERIGVDHVARVSVADNSSTTSLASEQLQAHYQAIQMLHSRVCLLRDYVKSVEAGTLPGDQVVLREIRALSRRLPVASPAGPGIGGGGGGFAGHLYTQCNDVCLTGILASLTQGLHSLYHYLHKQSMAQDRKGTRLRTSRDPLTL